MTPEQLAKAGTEHAHQVALMQWIALNKKYMPDMDKIFAVPNGGERNPVVAARLKAEGVRAGVPDLVLPVAVAPFHGLYIEMKKPATAKSKAGRATDDQLKRIAELQGDGYAACVCEGYKQAANALVLYVCQAWNDPACRVPFPEAVKQFDFDGSGQRLVAGV